MLSNVSFFHNELISVGLQISGCSSDGTVQISSRPTCPEGEESTWTDPTDTLVALVLAAHEQPLSSDEALALQAELTEEQWLSYTDCRKAPIKAARVALYKESTDALFMAAMEESTTLFDAVEQVYNVKVDKPKWDEWLEEKEKIRITNPYPS